MSLVNDGFTELAVDSGAMMTRGDDEQWAWLTGQRAGGEHQGIAGLRRSGSFPKGEPAATHVDQADLVGGEQLGRGVDLLGHSHGSPTGGWLLAVGGTPAGSRPPTYPTTSPPWSPVPSGSAGTGSEGQQMTVKERRTRLGLGTGRTTW
jgi:hypothetical protein